MFEHGTGTEYAKDPKGQPCFAGHSSIILKNSSGSESSGANETVDRTRPTDIKCYSPDIVVIPYSERKEIDAAINCTEDS